MDNQTSTFYTEILKRLDGVRKKEQRLSLFYGSLATLLLAIAVILLAIVLEEVVQFGTVGRTVLFGLAALTVAASIGWFMIRPLLYLFGVLKSENDHALAEKVGASFPQIRDRLLDALQIYESRDYLKERYSLSLIDASFVDLYHEICELDFTDMMTNARVAKMGRMVSFASLLFFLTVVVAPSGFFNSMHRLIHFNESLAAELAVILVVEPGNIDAVRGQTVPITVRAFGRPVPSLSLSTRQIGQVEFDRFKLTPAAEGVFASTVTSIKASMEYFASVEDISSDKFTINVIDRPLIRSMHLTVTSPSYTRIPARVLEENVGDVTAYPGSRVNLDLTSSKELTSASALFSDSSGVKMRVDGVNAVAVIQIKKGKKYRLLLHDKKGLTNLDPVEYTIKVIPDEYPTVEVLAPGKNIDLTEEMKLDLFVRLKDDFGFSKLRLAYRLAQSKYEKPSEEYSFADIPFPAGTRAAADLWHHWDLSQLRLVPEDALVYYVEVLDNDNVSGPKSGKSETYMIRLPSLEEVLSDVSESQHISMESMQSLAKETQQLKKDVEELQREMRKNREKMDWQQQQKAEQMLQRYEAMKKNLEQTSQKVDEMVKKMEDHKLLSDKTMEKYQELQKLLDELKSPELQNALRKLQQSMKQLSPEQMKQAMEQLKASEDQFRKNLERMVELLKRIHIEQKLDELIKRTEELMKQQEALRQQASKTNPSDQTKRDELAQQQEDLQKRMEGLEKEISELKKKMEEFPKEMPIEEMTKTEEQIRRDQTGQKMQQAARQMKSGNMQGAEKNQEQSQKELSDLDIQLQSVQKALQQNQMKQIVNEMRKQLQNVIELSKEEEALKNESRGLDPNSQRFRKNAEGQNGVRNDLNNVANALGELAKKSFAVSPEMGKEIGNAMKQMDEALQNMENRNPAGTSQKQSEAMGSLNRAAMAMQGALQGLRQGGQGGMGMTGLLGRLGQMAGSQGNINGQTQQALGQGEGMGAQQQAEYQRLAGQQAALQKSLEELSKEAKNGGDFSKLLGDLDQVAKQMQEVQTDLVQGNVNPETIQKQDRILSRLLDASRSTRERDYEKRRRSEAGKNVEPAHPADIDLTTQEGRNRLREEMLKVLEGKYSKDYEELIRKYFEQLEKEKVVQ